MEITSGLPAEKGRIGIAIAASNTEYVYAYVESKPSAIYRSTDGGISWEKRGQDNIGTRPFYYAEIYVDPKNENRVYTLFSGVNVSEDGGLTFDKRITESIHPDHHAWFIDPANPNRIFDGNDGGMAISYDKGETWRHIENLPLGQFYHINVDNEIPYNIYGGCRTTAHGAARPMHGTMAPLSMRCTIFFLAVTALMPCRYQVTPGIAMPSHREAH
jgi:hypothetical protein